jgi:hypothetical protein
MLKQVARKHVIQTGWKYHAVFPFSVVQPWIKLGESECVWMKTIIKPLRWYSMVGVVNRLWDVPLWGSASAGSKRFSCVQNIQTSSGCLTASCSVGARLFCLGVKWPRCETDLTPVSSAKAKKGWICMSPLPVCLYGVQRDSFSLLALL